MGKILSMDLRSRAMGAVEGGMSCRGAAGHFGVAPSTVIRWRSRQKEMGNFEARRRGRKADSVLDAYCDLNLSIYEANRDATLAEMCAALAEKSVHTSKSSLDHFFANLRYRKTTTLVAGLCLSGMVAPMVLNGPINGDWFEGHIEQILVPTLKPGDTVIMDNLSSHKRLSVKMSIEAAGAKLLFLPPYSPDFSPIEKAFSELKANLRCIGERTVTGLWDIIGSLVTMFKRQERHNYLASCGYNA
jgi:transposase